MNQQVFQPGDTVRFLAGRAWTGQFAPRGSGAEGAPVTATSYGSGAKPVIAGANTVPSAVLLENLTHWTLDGLEVTNGTGSTTWRVGVEVRAKDIGAVPGITLRNLYVHGIDGVAQLGKGNIGSAGILVNVRGNSVPTYYTGMLIEDNEIADTKAYGITTWSTWMQREGWTSLWSELGVPSTEYGPFRPSTGLVIRGNFVHDVGSGGINPNQVADTLVEYNTVARPTSTTTNVGIWWSGADRTTVQYNEVYGARFGGRGLDCTAFDADASTHDSLVQYNYSHDNGGGFFLSVSSAPPRPAGSSATTSARTTATRSSPSPPTPTASTSTTTPSTSRPRRTGRCTRSRRSTTTRRTSPSATTSSSTRRTCPTTPPASPTGTTSTGAAPSRPTPPPSPATRSSPPRHRRLLRRPDRLPAALRLRRHRRGPGRRGQRRPRHPRRRPPATVAVGAVQGAPGSYGRPSPPPRWAPARAPSPPWPTGARPPAGPAPST
ncbi:right-handed parallel beta-helix repeat-containing protein [Streptomyces diastatochromogenes]|nr:right-handed parallel beta-helix repeat-containing protein [Streptomyces diastatochromogenes]